MTENAPKELYQSRHERHAEEKVGRNWASARTILDALILAGVIGILTSLFNNHDRIADNAATTQAQFATIIAQISNIQVTLADVPKLRDKVTENAATIRDLERRQSVDDNLWSQVHTRK